MKTNWNKLIFYLIILLVWLIFMFISLATDKKEKRQKNLRENFSPMSKDAEIQKAYDAIR